MTALVRNPQVDFAVVHNPVAATQATISQTAPANAKTAMGITDQPAGVVPIIITSVIGSIATNGTAATPVSLHLRDGATGAGTIKWSAILAAPANGAAMASQHGLAIPCVSGTATLEFSGAGVAASQESVAMSGYFRNYGD